MSVRRGLFRLFSVAALAAVTVSTAQSMEAYVAARMPPGIHIEDTALFGAVFADAKGRTLYRWPTRNMRIGTTGDQPGKPSNCHDVRATETAGLMSPYRPGYVLPDLDSRPTCAQVWPPVLAPADAKPVGGWTLAPRADGTQQWAYEGYPLYTFSLDTHPGDVLGAVVEEKEMLPELRVDFPTIRGPVGPRALVPPGFAVVTTVRGRQLVTREGWAVYTSDQDTGGKSNCGADCTQTWTPLIAPAFAEVQGAWSLVPRAPGITQWAYRGKPLYTYSLDPNPRDRVTPYIDGIDVPGWHAVYVKPAPAPPSEFTVQNTFFGQVLADRRGMTIYTYNCSDDAVDQLPCDHPATTQVYRLALCGAGDAQKCLQNWPLVPAPKSAQSTNRLWSVVQIDPLTGRTAAPGQAGSMRVWAYRDRPVYTYVGDKKAGDTNGDARGEYEARRQGFLAYRYRNAVDEPNN